MQLRFHPKSAFTRLYYPDAADCRSCLNKPGAAFQRTFLNGRGGIRTHGGFPHARFRVECLKPDSATLPRARYCRSYFGMRNSQVFLVCRVAEFAQRSAYFHEACAWIESERFPSSSRESRQTKPFGEADIRILARHEMTCAWKFNLAVLSGCWGRMGVYRGFSQGSGRSRPFGHSVT